QALAHRAGHPQAARGFRAAAEAVRVVRAQLGAGRRRVRVPLRWFGGHRRPGGIAAHTAYLTTTAYLATTASPSRPRSPSPGVTVGEIRRSDTLAVSGMSRIGTIAINPATIR